MGFVEHLNCCAEQCAAIAEVVDRNFLGRIPIDRDVLIAGALLADIGKLFEYELDDHGAPCVGERGRLLRHPFIGVSLCERHGLPDEVAHIVATHSHEGDLMQRSVEAIIFHHADFIDFDIARLLDRGARP
ncbi:MAG: HD domain-containing protein [Phycisphaerales bacterium JB040]